MASTSDVENELARMKAELGPGAGGTAAIESGSGTTEVPARAATPTPQRTRRPRQPAGYSTDTTTDGSTDQDGAQR